MCRYICAYIYASTRLLSALDIWQNFEGTRTWCYSVETETFIQGIQRLSRLKLKFFSRTFQGSISESKNCSRWPSTKILGIFVYSRDTMLNTTRKVETNIDTIASFHNNIQKSTWLSWRLSREKGIILVSDHLRYLYRRDISLIVLNAGWDRI